MRGPGSWFLGVSLLLSSTVALGQTDQERAAARSLATEGINAYSAGHNAEALDKLERAYQLAPIPTIGLWSARALEKAGKLVEANERLLAVGRFQITKDESGVFAQAKTEAEQLQNTLSARVPELQIDVTHADDLQYVVELDGQALKSALLNVPFQANPGKHTVVARAGTEAVRKDVSVAERASARVALDLSGIRRTPATAAAAPPAPGDSGAHQVEDTPKPVNNADSAPQTLSGMSGKHVVGWVVLGIGGAGLVTGGVLGAKAIEQHSLYEDRCPGGKCSTEYQDYYDTFQRNQMFALISGGIGIVGVGAGLYLLLSSDGPARRDQAYLRPWIGYQSIGAEGRF